MPVVASDGFSNTVAGLDTPATNAVAITPSDTDDLAATCRYLYIGVSGDVKVNMSGTGTGIVFKAVPVGLLRIRASRVYATGTTATNIVALS